MHREEWGKHKFNEKSALKVVDTGEKGYDFYVNVDNIHLQTEQKMSSGIDPKLLEARYKYGVVLVGMALLKDNETSIENCQPDSSDDIYSQIQNITEALSAILLPMISSLGDLKVEELQTVLEVE